MLLLPLSHTLSILHRVSRFLSVSIRKFKSFFWSANHLLMHHTLYLTFKCLLGLESTSRNWEGWWGGSQGNPHCLAWQLPQEKPSPFPRAVQDQSPQTEVESLMTPLWTVRPLGKEGSSELGGSAPSASSGFPLQIPIYRTPFFLNQGPHFNGRHLAK